MIEFAFLTRENIALNHRPTGRELHKANLTNDGPLYCDDAQVTSRHFMPRTIHVTRHATGKYWDEGNIHTVAFSRSIAGRYRKTAKRMISDLSAGHELRHKDPLSPWHQCAWLVVNTHRLRCHENKASRGLTGAKLFFIRVPARCWMRLTQDIHTQVSGKHDPNDRNPQRVPAVHLNISWDKLRDRHQTISQKRTSDKK